LEDGRQVIEQAFSRSERRKLHYPNEMIWLAGVLVFLGSFGLGCTVEDIMRRKHARAKGENKGEN
jgi:hypothetical protein